MKFGFEKELFIYDSTGAEVVTVSNALTLPHDACGYLAEARGEPHNNPHLAAASMLGYQHLLYQQAERLHLTLQTHSHVRLPKKFRQACMRRFGKDVSHEKSLTGHYHKDDGWSRAGLHIHFSNLKETYWKDADDEYHVGNPIPGLIDMPKFIVRLDRKFAAEILAAKRVPGLYEMKPHGFEYRSLPATIDPYAVADALKEIMAD